MPETRRLSWPWLTVTVIVAAIITFLRPAWSETLIYDRAALAQGELWRLWTGHLVHFSGQHLLLDLFAFGISAAIVESCHGNRGREFILAAAGCLSGGLYLLEPALARFGGLSGIATCTMLIAVFCLMQNLPAYRRAGCFLIGVICLKVVAESFLPLTTLAGMATVSVFKMPLSHTLGALLALIPLYWYRREPTPSV